MMYITPTGGYKRKEIMPCCDKKKELMDRLARAEGHLKKVKTMVFADEYCINVITQSLAVQSALKAIDKLILKNHLETCVKEAIEADKDVTEKIDEVIKTVEFMRK